MSGGDPGTEVLPAQFPPEETLPEEGQSKHQPANRTTEHTVSVAKNRIRNYFFRVRIHTKNSRFESDRVRIHTKNPRFGLSLIIFLCECKM